MRSQPEPLWGGDVVVVGAGVAGTLIASALSAADLAVTLVEASGFGARQSNHSHGYLHRGYIYHQPSESLVKALGEGADRWITLFESAGYDSYLSTSTVAFTNPVNADRASDNWRAAQLPVVRGNLPARFRPGALVSAFETTERAYDFTPWFQFANRKLLRDVSTLKGAVVRLLTEGNRVTALHVRRDSFDLAVRARYYVLAAGVSNVELIEGAAQIRGRALNRTSFMLVVEGALPLQSVVIPDNDAYGLFIVSRPSAALGQSVWLVSNYISYAAGVNSVLGAGLWLRGIGRVLRRLTDVIDDGAFRWGFYPAPKAELRPDPRLLSEHATESYGFTNCLVASPSKLTLAPLLADTVVSEVLSRIERASTPDVPAERWKTVRWRQGSDLLKLLDHDDLDLEDAIELDLTDTPQASSRTREGRASRSVAIPSVFISYAHDDPRWRSEVIAFADSLARIGGIEVALDVYGSPIGRAWGAWGAEQVHSSDFVMCLGSPQYITRWNISFGSGVANEARAIRSRLNRVPDTVLFVLLPGRTRDDLPEDVRNVHYEIVGELTREGLDNVLRIIHRQPRFLKRGQSADGP